MHFSQPPLPTLIRHNSTPPPDIILSNSHSYLNTHFQPGPLTPSDHIPIIATITANPIQIPINPRPHIHKDDWYSYKFHLRNINIPNPPSSTKDEIDRQLNQWTKAIQDASIKAMPTITIELYQGSNHRAGTK